MTKSRKKLRIWSYLLRKSFMENFIFWAARFVFLFFIVMKEIVSNKCNLKLAVISYLRKMATFSLLSKVSKQPVHKTHRETLFLDAFSLKFQAFTKKDSTKGTFDEQLRKVSSENITKICESKICQRICFKWETASGWSQERNWLCRKQTYSLSNYRINLFEKVFRKSRNRIF